MLKSVCPRWGIICWVVTADVIWEEKVKLLSLSLSLSLTHTHTHTHPTSTHEAPQRFCWSLASVCQWTVSQMPPRVPKYVPPDFSVAGSEMWQVRSIMTSKPGIPQKRNNFDIQHFYQYD